MKKSILSLLVVIFLLAGLFTFSFPVSAAGGAPVFVADFSAARDYGNNLNLFSSERGGCEISYGDDSLKATATVDNANWFLGCNANFTANSNQYAKFRIKNETAADTFEIWASADPIPTNALEKQVQFWEISKNDSEFKEYVFKIEDNTVGGKWDSGDIKRLRIDFVVNPNPSKSQTVYIDYFAVFNSQEDANSFNIDTWEAANPPAADNRAKNANGNPTLIFDFSLANKDAIAAYFTTKLADFRPDNQTWTENYFEMKAWADQTNWSFRTKIDKNAQDIQWVVARIKNGSGANQLEFFGARATLEQSKVLSVNVQYPISTYDSDFKTYIFNMADWCNLVSNNIGVWAGTINELRFDFSDVKDTASERRATTNETFAYDYVAFFTTEHEAKSFDISAYRKGTYVYTNPTGNTPGTTSPVTTAPKTLDISYAVVAIILVSASLPLFIYERKKSSRKV